MIAVGRRGTRRSGGPSGLTRLGVLAFGDSITNGGGELQWGVALQSWALWVARGLGLPFTGYAVDGARAATSSPARSRRSARARRRRTRATTSAACTSASTTSARRTSTRRRFAADHAHGAGVPARALRPGAVRRRCPRTSAARGPTCARPTPSCWRAARCVLDLRGFGARNLVMTDHVHPTAFGQVWIAERALDVLAADGMDVRVRPSGLIAPGERTRLRALQGDWTYVYRRLKVSLRAAAAGAPSCSSRIGAVAVGAEHEQAERRPAHDDRGGGQPADLAGRDQHGVDRGADAEQQRPGQRQLATSCGARGGSVAPAGLRAVERGDEEADERLADQHRAGEHDGQRGLVEHPRHEVALRAARLRSAMNAASPVPSSPPMALTTGRRRISRSIVSSTETPTATAAAVCSPAIALTITNASGPSARVDHRPAIPQQVQRAGRHDRAVLTRACAPRASGCRRSAAAGGGSSSRRSTRWSSEVAAVGVLDPRPRGCPAGRRVASSVRLNQPNQLASSSSPRTRTSANPAARGEALQVVGDERVHVHHALQRVLVLARLPSCGAARAAPRMAAPPQRRERAARRAWARRRSGRPVRDGSPAKNSVPPGRSTRSNSANARSRSGRWCSTAWPSTRSKDSSGERQLGGVAGRGLHVEAELRRRCASSVASIPGLMSVQVAAPHHAGLQQVEAEVARARADLQRARERPGARAEQLGDLAQHLLLADLAERDAPLGVVGVRRHVVVAAVDVEDLVLCRRRGHEPPKASLGARSGVAMTRRAIGAVCDPAHEAGQLVRAGARG